VNVFIKKFHKTFTNQEKVSHNHITGDKSFPDKQEALLLDIKEIFGGTLEIPVIPFAYHLGKYKARMKQCEQGRNSEWKASFLNRLAPLTINCSLKYEKPKKEGKRK